MAIEVADMDTLLERGAYSAYLKVHEALCDLLKDHGPEAFNSDQLLAFMHPYRKWGSQAGWRLYKLRKTPDKQATVIKAHRKDDALDHIDGDTLEMLVEAGELTVARNIYQAIKIRGVNTWTDGQRKFVELYESCVLQGRNAF